MDDTVETSEQSGESSRRKRVKQVAPKGIPNVRWKPQWSKSLMLFLIEQVRGGYKVDKGFKAPVYIAAAKHINEEFGINISDNNAYNHWRTLKTRWVRIQRLKELSGVGWDEENKVIQMGEEEYSTYIEANPKDEPFINKPIQFYEEMSLICGNDHATGKYTVDTHQPIGLEDIEEVMEDGTETNDMMEDMDMIGRIDSTSSRGTSIQSSTRGPSGSISQGSKVKNKIKSGKKIKDLQLEMMSKMATGVCGVSEVMLMKHQAENERARKIIEELGKLQSFKQQDLDKACDFLMEHSSIAAGFLMRSHEQKVEKAIFVVF
ncbi:uncharacterized protein LOC109841912 [Asparagus officinalis]|nr:uncharacterized protein LOC109841912 [Asparagus officinalis]